MLVMMISIINPDPKTPQVAMGVLILMSRIIS